MNTDTSEPPSGWHCAKLVPILVSRTRAYLDELGRVEVAERGLPLARRTVLPGVPSYLSTVLACAELAYAREGENGAELMRGLRASVRALVARGQTRWHLETLERALDAWAWLATGHASEAVFVCPEFLEGAPMPDPVPHAACSAAFAAAIGGAR